MAGLVLELLLRPYAQVIFSRSLLSGALVLIAIALWPVLAVTTMVSVVIAHAASLLFGIDLATARSGETASIAVLTILALAGWVDITTPVLLVTATLIAVLFAVAFKAAFASRMLPAYSLPFVAAALIAVRRRRSGWAMRLRKRRPSSPALAAVYATATLFGLLPHVEELVRCSRAGRGPGHDLMSSDGSSSCKPS